MTLLIVGKIEIFFFIYFLLTFGFALQTVIREWSGKVSVWVLLET